MQKIDLTDAKIYDQLCDNIRKTDDISFKLIGLVPLVSGTGLISILMSDKQPGPPVIILLSLFAAAITLGIFRWELRNTQTCRWQIKFAEELEKNALDKAELTRSYIPQPGSPQSIGKREAEKFIYGITIAAWLAFPAFLLPPGKLDPFLYRPYLPVAAVIALATIISLFARIEPDKKPGAEKLPDKLKVRIER